MARMPATISAAVLACLLGLFAGPVGTAPAAPAAAKASADIPADETREIRTWHLKKGTTVEARLLETKGGTNVLQKEDGSKMKVHRSGLSPADLEYIQQVKDTKPEPAEGEEAAAEDAPPAKAKTPPGLVLWLDAADPKTVAVEGGVAQWADKSGSNFNAVQPNAGNRPTYVQNAFGKMPMVHFESGGQWMTTDCIPATGKDPRTLVIAVANLKQIENSLLCHLLHYGSPENEKAYGITYRGWKSVNWGNHYWHGSLNSGIPTNSGGGYIVVAMLENGADHYIVNGGASYRQGDPWPQGAIDTAGGGQKLGLCIGGRILGGEGAWGDIGEVMAFSRAITPQERMSIEGYLAHKWGMADLLPAEHPFKKKGP